MRSENSSAGNFFFLLCEPDESDNSIIDSERSGGEEIGIKWLLLRDPRPLSPDPLSDEFNPFIGVRLVGWRANNG